MKGTISGVFLISAIVVNKLQAMEFAGNKHHIYFFDIN